MAVPTLHRQTDFVTRSSGVLTALADIVSILISYLVTNRLFPQYVNVNASSIWDSGAVYFVQVAFAVLIIFLTLGHYTQRLPWWNQVRTLFLISALAALTEGFISFVFRVDASPLMIVTRWFFCFVLFIFLRLFFFRIRARLTGWNIPTVVIGDTSTASDILYALNADPWTGYEVEQVFIRDTQSQAFDTMDLPRRYQNLTIERDIINYPDFIRENPELFYIVVLDAFRGMERDRIVETMKEVGARFAVAPSISGMSLYEMEPRYFFGFDVMILHAKNALTHPLSRLSKRVIDIAASLCGILFFLPFFAIIYTTLKLQRHEGSVFYGGERLGQDGKLFRCWKFRTMAPDSDHLLHEYLARDPDAKFHWEKYMKLPDDPRVKTGMARFLRKSSLDEIPQLWNVFIGDMSIVGPRPILESETEAYGETIREYMRVKPGVTGLWQISGRSSASFQRRIYWDSWYVRNWSLWGDIVIILKTIPAVLLREDAH